MYYFRYFFNIIHFLSRRLSYKKTMSFIMATLIFLSSSLTVFASDTSMGENNPRIVRNISPDNFPYIITEIYNFPASRKYLLAVFYAACK